MFKINLNPILQSNTNQNMQFSFNHEYQKLKKTIQFNLDQMYPLSTIN
jgi:hypothetical protein